MTRNRSNTQTPITRSLVVAMTLTGLAYTGSAYADNAAQTAAVVRAAAIHTARPTHDERSFDLRKHGNRFKLAIKAIRENNKKPDWTWADTSDRSHNAGTN